MGEECLGYGMGSTQEAIEVDGPQWGGGWLEPSAPLRFRKEMKLIFDDNSPMPIGAMPDFILTLVPPTEQSPMAQGRPGTILIMDPMVYHVVRDIVMKKITSEQVQQFVADAAMQAQMQSPPMEEIPNSNWDGKTFDEKDNRPT